MNPSRTQRKRHTQYPGRKSTVGTANRRVEDTPHETHHSLVTDGRSSARSHARTRPGGGDDRNPFNDRDGQRPGASRAGYGGRAVGGQYPRLDGPGGDGEE